MRALLICPADRPAVSLLAEHTPLALLPVLGKTVVEYWLEHLYARGAREVFILADDRPEQIRAAVGDGARWGLRVDVLPEIRELTPTEARAKYRLQATADWLTAPDDATLMDRLPGLEQPLFDQYADWFTTAQAWFSKAVTPDRIGIREFQPGVWVGLNTRVSPQAELRAPCWLGENVCVEPGAVVGPRAIVEDRSLVAAGAEVTNSIVGPETYVGELTEVNASLAWGNMLVRWNGASCTKVTDSFLLSSLAEQRQPRRFVSLTGRLAAACTMLLAAPFAALAALKAMWDDQPVLAPKMAVKPQLDGVARPVETLLYYELGCGHQWLRRWPQLWNVIRGEFAWVGNRPLNPTEAQALASDFERLWLAAPIGLVSLADAEACADMLGDDARAHATYYAARARWQLDLSILARVLSRFPGVDLALPNPIASPLPRADINPALRESKSL
jgi:hypothetical protein